MTAPAQPPAYLQLSEEWLKNATPEQIVTALEAGQLQHLLTGVAPPEIPAAGQLTGEHMRAMSPEQVMGAYEAGRFHDVLTGQQSSPPPAPAPPAGPVLPTPEQIAAWTAEATWLAPPANPQG